MDQERDTMGIMVSATDDGRDVLKGLPQRSALLT